MKGFSMNIRKTVLLALVASAPAVASAQSTNPWSRKPVQTPPVQSPVAAPQYSQTTPVQAPVADRYAPADLDQRLSAGKTYMVPTAPTAPVVAPVQQPYQQPAQPAYQQPYQQPTPPQARAYPYAQAPRYNTGYSTGYESVPLGQGYGYGGNPYGMGQQGFYPGYGSNLPFAGQPFGNGGFPGFWPNGGLPFNSFSPFGFF
jgi:hypothetical protein